jgi:ribosomal protein S18 acetylase RimI-like enzyme
VALRLREAGAELAVVSTPSFNEGAIRLYETLGFRRLGRRLEFRKPPGEGKEEAERS